MRHPLTYRFFIGFVFLALAASCAPTKTLHVWKDDQYNQRLKKVLIIAVTEQEYMRDHFENVLAENLESRGITAVASNKVLPQLGAKVDREAIAAKVRELGIGNGQVSRSMLWYQKTKEEVLDHFKSGPQGISPAEALSRLGEYRHNELEEKKKKTSFMMLLDQFRDFLIIVLAGAAVLSGVIGDFKDTIAIIIIIVINAIVGFIQEYRAEKAMSSLKKMAAPTSTVLRDGISAIIPASDIVPGDIVMLEAGKVVPADIRLTESAQLKIDEAALTGESLPVEKHVESLPEVKLPVGDRKNMVYKGTVVSYGRGSGVVVATGMDTEIGKIASMLQEEEEVKTPLQKRLQPLGKNIAFVVFLISSIVLIVGIVKGETIAHMFLTGSQNKV